MSDVFISYKREDEVRAGRLARALEAAGLSVWWDRGLPGGESWRSNIEKNLHGARCVIVAWSRASVAPEGHFVRDEAGHALAKGMLVPVFFDLVPPPVGFGEIQAIDLAHWRGNPKDAFFHDLVAAVRAKLDGTPAPTARGPSMRLWRRLSWGGSLSVAAAVLLAMVTNFNNITAQACTATLQPTLSDGCGALGLGGRPSRPERLLWQARRAGSCEDIRRYVERYHDGGAFLTEASALLAARRVGTRDSFTPGTRKLSLYVMQADTGAPSEAASRAKALKLAQDQAVRNCRSFSQTTLFKLESAEAEPEHWQCNSGGSGVFCSLEGQAVCRLQERQVMKTESCGK